MSVMRSDSCKQKQPPLLNWALSLGLKGDENIGSWSNAGLERNNDNITVNHYLT